MSWWPKRFIWLNSRRRLGVGAVFGVSFSTMAQWREILKRSMPSAMRKALIATRKKLAAPPLEDIVLHDYELVPDPDGRPRLSLIIPTFAPEMAFGGVTTGIDIFLEIGRRAGVSLRVVVDDFGAAGVDTASIEIVPRTATTQRLSVRADDVFFSFNWWTTLNLRPLLRKQAQHFGGAVRPYLYAIQEYEPLFYPLSSTHMMARLAFDPREPCWGLFNSHELYTYFQAQGHAVERAFVFEPKLSDSLRPFLGGEAPVKARRILVYGRPAMSRNCYPALEKGLRLWAEHYPEFGDWEVVSAGLPHPPLSMRPGMTMKSLGKLSLQAYGELLRTTAVGLSLMASPHPSYPPLEMAHFGILTITNTFANKDLATSHPNIHSIADIGPDTIAAALAQACRAFDAAPDAAWGAPSLRPAFLETIPWPFLEEVAQDLRSKVWTSSARG